MMLVTAPTAAWRAVVGRAVLAVLFTGLVGMHHIAPVADRAPSGVSQHERAVAAPVEPGAGTVAHVSTPSPPGSHEDHVVSLLHLCLAVLTAIAVLAAVLLVWRARRDHGRSSAPRRAGWPRTAPRAPPPSTSARLALLCVLRT